MTTIKDMSDTDYHAHKAIGSTTAKLFLDSPQLFNDALTGVLANPDKPHFAIGRLAHMMVLEPKRFADQVIEGGPINEKTGKPYGRGTKAYEKWQADNPGVITVEPELYIMLERMPPEIRSIFDSDGQSEISTFIDVNDKFQMKCRCDYLVGTTIYDLKSIDNIDNVEKQIAKLKYWFSSEWYKHVMLKETGQYHQHILIFCEKKPPFRWVMIEQDQDYKNTGAKVVRDTVDSMAERFKTNTWTDDAWNVHRTVKCPDYILSKGFDYAL